MNKQTVLQPLSHAQKRIWYTEKLHSGTSMWNNAGTLKISGEISPHLLERAINAVLRDCPDLRTRITVQNTEPFQYIHPYSYQQIEVFDFINSSPQSVAEWEKAEAERVVPYLNSPLYYFAVLKLSDNQAELFVRIHHIISDAYSLITLVNRITDAYACFLDGREYECAQIPPYTEYIENENKYLSCRRCENDLEYLTEKFKDLPKSSDPIQGNINRGTDALRRTFCSSADSMSGINKYCADFDVSVFSVILSAFFTYLYKTTGKDDLIIGTSVLNRISDREKDTFGIFVGMVPLRVRLNPDLSFLETNRLVADEILSALRRQKYPYNLLMQQLRKENKGLNSLFDITLSFQNASLVKNAGRFSYTVNWFAPAAQTNGLDIHFNDRENNGFFTWDYNYLTSLFADNDIEQMHGRLKILLSDALTDPQKKISELRLLSATEENELIQSLRGEEFTPPKHLTVAELFKERVQNSPLSPTLVFKGNKITSKELDRRSDAVAARLIKSGAVQNNGVIVVMMRRSPALFAAILGILKAGGAFLPLDPSTPQQRAEFIAQKSGAAAAIADAEFSEYFKDLKHFLPAEEIDNLPALKPARINYSPFSVAYIIFTSGTTGEPKGVMIQNDSICGFIEKFKQIMDFKSGVNTLSVASPAFDIFIMESFAALTEGGAVVLASEDDGKIPQTLSALILENNVNSLMFMPSRMQLLLSGGFGDCLKGVKQIMLGGEELTESLVQKIRVHTDAEIYNFYGPTECTIAVTYQKVCDKKITIGRPMAGVQAYIAAWDGSLAPRGAAGELLIGGDCLARGYIGDAEKTAAAFIADPFKDGKRVYKTGDLVRLNQENEIEYLGRIDSQVKIRGFRIELNEIKAKIAELSGVDDCAVVDLFDEARGKYLCAYICGNPPPFSQILESLRRILPHYMIPQYFVRLNQLPLTLGGKLNKGALPVPDEGNNVDSLCGGQAHTFTRTEMILADIWEQILKRRPKSPQESFFEAGGDSMSLILTAGRVARDLGVDVALNAVYANPTLKGYAALIDGTQDGYKPVQRGEDAEDYAVSAGQRRLYMLTEIEDSPLVYNVPGAFKIKGAFDKNKFEQAFKRAINIHGSLKTSFFIRDGELRQKIHDSVNFDIKTRKCTQAELDGVLRSLVRPFDFKSPPLIRAEFIEVDNAETIVFIDMHHIISDGVSAELLFKHIAQIYNGGDIKPYPLRYVDYSVWQNGYLSSDSLKNQREYWLNEMKGELPQLALRTDYPRKKRQAFKGRHLELDFPRDLRRQIGSYAAAKGITAHTVMLGAFYILMHRYSGNEDIIAGIPTAGRSRAEFADIAGMFVNTLALRAFPKAQKSAADFFKEVNKTVIGGMLNQDYPFESLVSDLKIPRDLSRNPLFDVFFSYNTSSLRFKLDGAEVKEIDVPRDISKFDLSFEVRDTSDNLRWDIEYCTCLFSDGTIRRMAEHYINILSAAVADDAVTIGGIEMLSSAEKEKTVKRMRGKSRRIAKNASFENALKFNAKNTPDNTALIFKDNKLTFKELDSLTARLALVLKNKGVGRDTVVAVSLNRSTELALSIIAVLRAGGAYLPIDPEYPPDRVAYMLKDSGATIALTDRPVNGIDVINPADVFDGPCCTESICEFPCPADLKASTAYLIYTSGSTGLPKGVRVSYSNLINYCEACREYSIFNRGDTTVSVTTVSFDIFVLEFLVALYHGAAVALCDEEEQRVPAVLAEVITKNNAAFIQFTPSRLELMLEDPSFCRALATVKTLVCGGEAMTERLLAKIKKITSARIINFYGPTETTVYSTLKDLTKSKKVTIGKPVLNTDLYILDASMNLAPQGVVGELYIGGDGVALGYHNRQELTAERFINDSIKGHGKVYKTGDLACLLPNGEILCLGRADNQIKFGGHRIEPDEIEKVILTLNGIIKAVVVVRRVSGSDRLCAYYTASKDIDEDALRAHLKKTLPSYMVPAHLCGLKRCP